jgi:hypothetical protein
MGTTMAMGTWIRSGLPPPATRDRHFRLYFRLSKIATNPAPTLETLSANFAAF